MSSPSKVYDVIIIGAGTSGLAAQKEVAKGTSNYLVIDQGPLGTTCARVGCMPSKALIEVASVFEAEEKLRKSGISPGPKKKQLSAPAVFKHVRKLRDRFVAGVVRDMQPWMKTHLRKGRAEILGPGEIALDGQVLMTRALVLATGTEPVYPEAWARDPKRLWTSDTLFEINKWPKSMAVIGVGAIGLEMADAMSALGVRVVAYGEVSKIGGLTDPDLLKAARTYFGKRFELIEAEVETVSAQKKSVQVVAGGKARGFEKVLLALGRKTQLKKIGLENLGVSLNERGLPELKKACFQIPRQAVFIAGDANAERPLLHEANDQGRFVGRAALETLTRRKTGAGKTTLKYNPKTALAIAFTSVQIAVVGWTCKRLLEEKINFVEGRLDFSGQGRALTQMRACGLIKVYGCPLTGKIFGAEMFAPGAEHLAHLLAWSMDAGETVFDLLRKAFYHPTLEEGLRSALRDLERQVREQPRDAGDDALRSEPIAGTNCP